MEQILEYYDVPQIMTATDVTGTHYLCTLYGEDEFGYKYLGVQISEPRLMAFIHGQVDLRDAYKYPEVDNALYIVTAHQGELAATTMLQPQDVSDDMLPEKGYYLDSSDLDDQAEQSVDTYELKVPANDRSTFSTFVNRMGWRASALRRTIEKIAVL